MNERTKELLLKVGVKENWNEADWYSLNPEMIQKFAELIIADCAKLCEPAAQVEPFNPDWASYRQGKLDGAAEALAQPTSKDYAMGYAEGFNDACKPERPQNCGSGYCSCIECVMEPKQEPVAVDPLRKYLENIAVSDGWDESDGEGVYEYLQRKSYQAGYNAGVAHHKHLVQPEQEPVSEIVSDVNGYLSTRWYDEWTPNHGDKLYTSPPKREWMGLTDDEIREPEHTCITRRQYARAIEAKLKELNA